MDETQKPAAGANDERAMNETRTSVRVESINLNTRNVGGPARSILPHHAKHLADSGLRLDFCEAAGIYSETNQGRIESLIKCSSRTAKNLGAVIVFPFFDIDGRNGYCQIRPDNPRRVGDRVLKYESPKGTPPEVYIPPDLREYMAGTGELLITEGAKKCLKSWQEGFPTIALAGVWNWKQKGESDLSCTMNRINWQGRVVKIVFDSDAATNENIRKAESWLARHLRLRGAIVSVVRIPGDGDAKVGLDDYLVKHGPAKLRELLDALQEPDDIPPEEVKQSPTAMDAAIEAKRLLDGLAKDGFSTLRFWLGAFQSWSKGRYEEVSKDEVKASICQHLNEGFVKIGTSEIHDTLEQVKGQGILRSRTQPPCWLDGNGWNPSEVIATKNALVHLPSLADGKDNYSMPATPRFFTQTAVDFNFTRERRECPEWLAFLRSLWEEDSQSIELLQDWFGYCLTPDTKQQKILMLLGPQRSGKGTIVRVLRGVVGEDNVAGPTFSSIAQNFGLSSLLGKSLAVISDARLSSRADQAVITERLLSISGEDALDIDKKFQQPITTKLQTRMMIVSNEIPRLTETSGALAGRMLLLRLTRSFFGEEDRGLTQRLMAEREGILWWAIDGWMRLRERGYFVEPQTSVSMRNQLRELASPVGTFVDDCCEIGREYRVECPDLYRAWCEWCESSGRDAGTAQTFGRDLAAYSANIEAKQVRVGASRVRYYLGVKLRGNSGSAY